MSQAGPIDIIDNNPSIPTQFNGNSGAAVPLANIINIVGNTVQGVSTSGLGNTLTITVADATTVSKGVAQFDAGDFSVVGGVVTLNGGGGGAVLSVSGTANRITSTGGANPVIDIAATYVGQTSLTTLGTITTGTWNGTPIGPTFGGTGQTTYATGDILYASAANTLSKLPAAVDGQVLTLAAGIPSWATPTTGTVTSVSGTANRITSTGGTTPVIDISAAYVGQTSITTLGTITIGVWNGSVIPLAFGGTNANLTASNGGIFYSTATAGAILAGTATARQMLQSGASTTPAWSTATWPATTVVNELLYSSATNTVVGLATANNGILITSATGVPSLLANGTTGQVFTATTGSPPSWGTAPITRVNVQVFTSSGAFTYTPTAGTKYSIVELCGGGGGGGGIAATTANLALAGSGAGAGYAKFLLTAAQIGASLSGSVGAAGGGGAAGNNNGTAGGNTTLATTAAWTCAGGAAGAGGPAGTPGNSAATSGGVVTTGTGVVILNVTGEFGSDTFGVAASFVCPGKGGATPIGMPGYMAAVSGIANGAAAGTNASGYGAGGTGAAAYGTNTARAGGSGAPGIAIFTEFI